MASAWISLCVVTVSMVSAMGPFRQITASHFDVADASLGFGPADKAAWCAGELVYVDVPRGRTLKYSPAKGGRWHKRALSQPVPCADGSAPLLTSVGSEGSDYAVGAVAMSAAARHGGTRLVIIGSSVNATTFTSDDCGETWACLAAQGPQLLLPRHFGFTLGSGGDGSSALYTGGGVVMIGNSTISSVGLFVSLDGGESWARPECTIGGNCVAGLASPDPPGYGLCSDPSAYWNCYTVVFPGASGDYALDGDGTLVMSASQVGSAYALELTETGLKRGWYRLASSGGGGGGLGRRVFLRGASPGSGCWLSADYNSADLWLGEHPGVASSTNAFATASNVTGPWTVWPVPAPWAPRAAALLFAPPVPLGVAGHAYFGSGLGFSAGVPTGEAFADLWTVDTSVCLLAPSTATVCAGHGRPDLELVECVCLAGWSGEFCEHAIG